MPGLPSIRPSREAENGEGEDDARAAPRPCSDVPELVSDFVDAFVDFVVGGQVLGKPAALPSSAPGWEGGDGEPMRHPAAERVVAIGDLHGDEEKARSALRLARVVDEHDDWIGGSTVVVQVGDLLDRGSQELRILYLLEKLRRQAARAGGAVHVINGNHEVMNMEGNFRYASEGGCLEFGRWARWHGIGQGLKARCPGAPLGKDVWHGVPENLPHTVRARVAALRPGGAISARFFAEHPTVVMIGGSVFAHGGVLPAHAGYGLGRINEEVREWMLGKSGWRGPVAVSGRNAVVWSRDFSHEEAGRCDCRMLSRSLDLIPGAARMVVGHTIQERGISSACDDRVLRVDVGLSKGCGDGRPEVLEIVGDRKLVVRSSVSRPGSAGSALERGERAGLASLVN